MMSGDLALSRQLQEEHFSVQPSTIEKAGMGLFSKVPINKGDTIGHYTGFVISDEEAELEPHCDSHYILWVCRDCNIVGEGPKASYTRFINHAPKPNAEFIVSTRWKKARIAAIKPIKPGEEIFLDYGPYFWDEE
jgi:SET domain-containing protein